MQVNCPLRDSIHGNGKDELRLGLNVTDDFKSESFVIFKVFELSLETVPQVFLQSLVLIKIWDNWNTDFGDINGWTEDNSSLCSNQSIFFVSLMISVIQFCITMQDLLEREIPFGVFRTLFGWHAPKVMVF